MGEHLAQELVLIWDMGFLSKSLLRPIHSTHSSLSLPASFLLSPRLLFLFIYYFPLKCYIDITKGGSSLGHFGFLILGFVLSRLSLPFIRIAGL